MIVTLDIPKEIEAQMLADAEARGVPLSDYLRDFLIQRYQEDVDDLRTVEQRLNDPDGSLTSTQMRNNLGLDG